MAFIAVGAYVTLNLVNDNKWAIGEGFNEVTGDLSTVGQTRPECDAAHVGAAFGNEVCRITGTGVKCLDKGCTSQERTTNYAWSPRS